jgi:hypothetical protein
MELFDSDAQTTLNARPILRFERRIQTVSYYLHNVPGRLRIKIPNIKRRTKKVQSIIDLIKGLEGVVDISANEVTGSVVINYDTEIIDTDDILTTLKENNYIDEIKNPKRDHIQDGLSRSGEAMGKALFGWALGRMLENTGLSFLAVLV